MARWIRKLSGRDWVHLAIHFGALVYFALMLVQAIRPPLWLTLLVTLSNFAGVFRTAKIVKPYSDY
jgi:hypothetical protein